MHRRTACTHNCCIHFNTENRIHPYMMHLHLHLHNFNRIGRPIYMHSKQHPLNMFELQKIRYINFILCPTDEDIFHTRSDKTSN